MKQNVVARGINGFLDRSAAGLKAFTMTFQKQASYWLLPRTRYNYSTDLGDGLRSTLIVATVGWVVRNFTQAPIRLQKKGSKDGRATLDDVEEALTGPGAFLRLLRFPNNSYSGRVLLKALLTDYETRGECYALKIRNGSGRVMELWWVPWALIEPKWPDDGSAFIGWYEYNPNGIKYRVRPEDVLHIRDGMDPLNPRRGFNKLAALAREVFTDDEAANFSATVLSNMGIPGVIISPKDTGIASRNRIEDPEGIKDSYMQKFGGDRRGEPLILTSPTDVQVLSFSPQQMALKDLRRIPEERVAAVTGVPAVVAQLGAGLDRSTYSNMEEARQAAFEEKIIPTQSDWADALQNQLLIEFVGDVTVYVVDFDLSGVRVLQEDQNALVERSLKALLGGGITRRRFKELTGEDADELDDVYYLPTNVTVINALEKPPPTEEELEAEGDTIRLAAVAPEPQLLGPGEEPEAEPALTA